MKALTISNFRKSIKDHFDYVVKSMGIIVVPRNNDDDGVVIMSLKHYNSLIETEHLLSSPNNRKRLEESMAQIENNELTKYDDSKI
jgi:antitoxin YefM